MVINSLVNKREKMVDNSPLIQDLLSFSEPNTFYFVQILKRRKDNPKLERDMIHLADYYVTSMEKFEKLLPTIKEHCNRENARAYIRINRRDAKKLAFQVLKRVADYIISENYMAVKSVYSSCAGEFHGDPDRKWIVDIDWKDWVNAAEVDAVVIPLLEELQEEAGNEPLSKIIPTKNGIHIVTRPFNLQKFHTKYSNVDVHKDNMCILYCP